MIWVEAVVLEAEAAEAPLAEAEAEEADLVASVVVEAHLAFEAAVLPAGLEVPLVEVHLEDPAEYSAEEVKEELLAVEVFPVVLRLECHLEYLEV